MKLAYLIIVIISLFTAGHQVRFGENERTLLYILIIIISVGIFIIIEKLDDLKKE